MTTVLITGGAGGLGQELVPRLKQKGYAVRVASRSAEPKLAGVEWAQLDLRTGDGLARAVQGVDTIIHAASSAFKDTHEVDVLGTKRLLDASRHVRHFLYVSIVGIERIPFSYYQSKLAAEQIIEASDVPWSIQRATQFHSLVDLFIGAAARLPVMFLPTDWRFQPIDTGEVADVLARYAGAPPAGRLPDVGGPEVWRFGDLARSWLAARGMKRPIVRLPTFGKMAAGYRRGYNTTPNHQGVKTWQQWLAEKYGEQQVFTSRSVEGMETR